MSIVDDLVENLVERNGVRVAGAMTIELVDGGLRVSGGDPIGPPRPEEEQGRPQRKHSCGREPEGRRRRDQAAGEMS